MSPPFLTTQIVSGDSVAVGSPAQIPCLVLPSPIATTGATFAFNPGADPRPVLGYGFASDLLLYFLRSTSNVVNVAVAAPTWTAAPSVTHLDTTGGSSPTGPSMSAALGAAVPGCLDDHNIIVRVTTGGTLGTATGSVAYDGGPGVETFQIPTEGPAVLRGAVDITTPPSANTKTLVFTVPSSTTITFSTSPTTPQGLADAFNALAVSGTLAVRARVAQTATAQYLELYSTAVGTTAGITLDATSTGDTVFGLSNTGVVGTAATYTLPASGLVLTFPAGSYVSGESYLLPCTGPRMSLSAIAAAEQAAIAAFASKPFGFFVVPQPAVDAPTCKATVDALETIRSTALNATVPRDFYTIVGGTWHTASSTPATNAANILTADQALLAAFQSATANPNSVAQDDVYLTGSSLLAPGSFRRSAAAAMGVKRASAARVAATCAEGTIPEASLLASDGLTAARDQNTATVHLEGLQGPGFFCCKAADDAGGVKLALGSTRAGSTSRLQHDGDFAVCAEAARIAQGIVKSWEAQRPGTDPVTGMMIGHDKGSRAGQVDEALRSFLLPSAGLPNCSDFGVVVNDPPTGKFTDNGITPVKVTVYTLGTIQEVAITIAATGTTTIAAPAGA